MKVVKPEKLDRQERQFPLDAAKLVRKTYQEAIRSGRAVVVSRNGALFRVDRSGSTKIKDIERGTSVKKTKISLR